MQPIRTVTLGCLPIKYPPAEPWLYPTRDIVGSGGFLNRSESTSQVCAAVTVAGPLKGAESSTFCGSADYGKPNQATRPKISNRNEAHSQKCQTITATPAEPGPPNGFRLEPVRELESTAL
jgi:hypothetical protein